MCFVVGGNVVRILPNSPFAVNPRLTVPRSGVAAVPGRARSSRATTPRTTAEAGLTARSLDDCGRYDPYVQPDHERAGSFPYTRGIRADGYRGRLWTMRQYAGFGSAEETNERFRYCSSAGRRASRSRSTCRRSSGSTPTTRRARARSAEGVAIDSSMTCEALPRHPLDRVSTSMTINATAALLLRSTARRRGAGRRAGDCAARCRTTCSRSTSRAELHLPAAALAAPDDRSCSRYCARAVPRWNPISISGYHIREAGSTRGAGARLHARERHRVRRGGGRGGLAVDAFAPRLSFFFNVHNNFFEEVAKFRAARRLWARIDARALRRSDRALADAALPRPDGRRDADRPAAATTTSCASRCRRFAAVLGGAQSLHTNGSTRRSPCRPSARRSSRCAPSRSSPTKRRRDRSTRSAAPRPSRR